MSAHRAEEDIKSSLVLELEAVVSGYVGSKIRTQVLFCFVFLRIGSALTVEPSLQPQ